jgi:tRNA threonylcarbamoyladenosine biosynthesis protein TsaB
MPYILNIETATKNCSVSLALNGKTISYREKAEQGYSHAEFLHQYVNEVLKEAQIQFNDLAAVAVGQGPGSYTGLRIGVSAVKGWCFSLDIPMIAIDSLTILAKKVIVDKGVIIPMIDARRMEVYCSVLDAQYNSIQPIEAKIIDENSFNEIQETIYFVGDCNEKVAAILTNKNTVYLNDIMYPSAQTMSELSFEKFTKKEFVDVAYFEPFYLKDFVATTPKK